MAYDLLAGRMSQVDVTDRRGGEHIARYRWHAGEVIVADRGYGYRRSVATAVRQQADVVVRIHPATFPLETEAGQPFNVLRWLRQRGGSEREWHGWCRWGDQRYPVRLVAAKRDPSEITITFKGPVKFDPAAPQNRSPLTGSPAQIVEDLSAYVAAGVEHFVLDFSVPTVPEMLDVLERFAADVRPKVGR